MLTKMVEGSVGILEKFAPDKPALAEKLRPFSKIAFEVMDAASKADPKLVSWPKKPLFSVSSRTIY